MTTDPSGSVADVRRVPTSGGNTRFVLVDSDGREYSTFREEIGTALEGKEGKRAHIRYHEQRRGRFTNVYLDDVRLLDNESPDASVEEEALEDRDRRRALPVERTSSRRRDSRARGLRQAQTLQGPRRRRHRGRGRGAARRPRRTVEGNTSCKSGRGWRAPHPSSPIDWPNGCFERTGRPVLTGASEP